MPASEEVDGKHVYPGGKEMILTHAMSLSKQRWAPKAAEGTHEELYNEFLAEFDVAAAAAEAPEEEAPEWLVPPTIVRKTAEEKAAEMEAKKAEIEAKKAEKKAEREQAKAEAKAAKEAEKAAAKAAKVPKAAVPKAAVPKAAVKPAPKPIAKAAEVKASGKEEATTPRSHSTEPAKTPARKPTTANAKPAVWTCPADGAVHPWAYKGMAYLRNSDNQVWKEDADGGCGDWCGVFLGGEDRIDDSIEEPDFE
jgi:hypothetical protein